MKTYFYLSKVAVPSIVATSHMWLFRFIKIKFKIQFISHTSHISSAYQLYVASGFHTGKQIQNTEYSHHHRHNGWVVLGTFQLARSVF